MIMIGKIKRLPFGPLIAGELIPVVLVTNRAQRPHYNYVIMRLFTHYYFSKKWLKALPDAGFRRFSYIAVNQGVVGSSPTRGARNSSFEHENVQSFFIYYA